MSLRAMTEGLNETHGPSTLAGVQREVDGRWRAQIFAGGDVKYLGSFDTELEAAQAYQVAAEAQSMAGDSPLRRRNISAPAPRPTAHLVEAPPRVSSFKGEPSGLAGASL
jgi:hypothetical protein